VTPKREVGHRGGMCNGLHDGRPVGQAIDGSPGYHWGSSTPGRIPFIVAAGEAAAGLDDLPIAAGRNIIVHAGAPEVLISCAFQGQPRGCFPLRGSGLRISTDENAIGIGGDERASMVQQSVHEIQQEELPGEHDAQCIRRRKEGTPAVSQLTVQAVDDELEGTAGGVILLAFGHHPTFQELPDTIREIWQLGRRDGIPGDDGRVIRRHIQIP